MSKHIVARWDGVRLGGATLNLAVVGVHFKAIPTEPKSCAQREAQATLMRREIEALSAAGTPRPPRGGAHAIMPTVCHHADRSPSCARRGFPSLRVTVVLAASHSTRPRLRQCQCMWANP